LSRKHQNKFDASWDQPEFHLAEGEYRDLFHFASDAVWVHDLGGRIVVCNRAFEETIGQPVEVLYGRNVREFLSEYGIGIASTVKKKLLTGERAVESYEQRISRDDGTYAILEITTCLVMRQGKPVAFQNIARDVTEKRKAEDALKFYVRRVLQAQEEERKRISRDLHDETVQPLLLLVHGLDSVASQFTAELPEPAEQKLKTLRDLVAKTLENLRAHIQDLRPVILDDLGLPASLEWLADRLIAETGAEVKMAIGNEMPALPAEVELTIFRITQEALNNVRKHSKSREVGISLGIVGGQIRLTISDNGVGFIVPKYLIEAASSGKWGLMTMQERAQLLGGTIALRSLLGKGTVVVVNLPLGVETY